MVKVTKKIYNEFGHKLVKYYQNTEPFDRKGLIVDTLRLSDPKRLYRVLCSCAYLVLNKNFAGGILTRDILRVTGWKMPAKATDQQIAQDEIMSNKLEQKCRKYISDDMIYKLIKEHDLVLPVEWRAFYILYVPADIFTPDELVFMKNNPCWLLPLKE